MIYIMGDIHGEYHVLQNFRQFVTPTDTVIQVGDFGMYPNMDYALEYGFPCRVLIIAGNHEDYRIIRKWETAHGTDAPIEIFPNGFYVPRGYVEEIEGKVIGFLGGADSVDRYSRTEEKSWWRDEQITPADCEKLYANVGDRQLDILITHAPPQHMIQGFFPTLNKDHWGLPKHWTDVSAALVTEVWKKLKPKQTYSGHMHKPVTYDGCRILNIDEVVMVGDYDSREHTN